MSAKGIDTSVGTIVPVPHATTFDAGTRSPYEAEIKRAVQQVVLSRLIDLADTASMSQVRAIATQKLKAIQSRPLPATLNPSDVASQQLIAADIARFLARPSEPARRIAAPGTPPGAPIGDSGLDFLAGVFGECVVK